MATLAYRLGAFGATSAPDDQQWPAVGRGRQPVQILFQAPPGRRPTERGHVHAITPVIPVPASAAACAVVAVCGLILLRIAAGLRWRKGRAWQVAVVASSVTVLADVLKAHRIGVAAMAAALLASLIVSRDRFRAKDDPASRRLALRIAVRFPLVAFVFGLAMLYLNPRHVVGRIRGFPECPGARRPERCRAGAAGLASGVDLLVPPVAARPPASPLRRR